MIVTQTPLPIGLQGEGTDQPDYYRERGGRVLNCAVTVGLLHALFAYRGRQVTADELADRACTIEIDRCGKPIGKQHHSSAPCGRAWSACRNCR